jgi:hypothetical protein
MGVLAVLGRIRCQPGQADTSSGGSDLAEYPATQAVGNTWQKQTENACAAAGTTEVPEQHTHLLPSRLEGARMAGEDGGTGLLSLVAVCIERRPAAWRGG